ncbi:MAG: RNA 2',3'-cyclic phosphodiesterase [Candidatus Micrarchaeia archaeon]
MRAFIAIEIPNEIKERLIQLQEEIRSRFKKEVKMVEPENLHFTLRFFPEIDENTAEKIKDTIKNIEFDAFEIKCRGLGVFPNENYIRVIWVGGDSNGKLEGIEKMLSERLAAIGFKKEKDEEFVAHLTLARVKQKINFKDFLLKYREQDFGSFTISKDMIKLKKSQLTPKGPIYSDL